MAWESVPQGTYVGAAGPGVCASRNQQARTTACKLLLIPARIDTKQLQKPAGADDGEQTWKNGPVW